MASKSVATCVLLMISLNLFFFTSMVSSTLYAPSPPPPRRNHKCPRDTLKLGVCANLFNDLAACCSLIEGLVDLEAAVCLCTAIKSNVLGVNLDVPVSLSMLLNGCGMNLPAGFHCDKTSIY